MKKSQAGWDIIGHQWAVGLLSSRLAAGRASHAHLFTGIDSLGKSLMAVRLVQALNCTGQTPPCRACRACDLIERGQHPDVLVIKPEGGTIKIEMVRDLMSTLTLRPLEARFRVGIILDADKLTPSAADALLKTLEEPPETGRLLLTALHGESVPLTVASRCQVIPLRPVPVDEITAALIDRLNLPADQAGLLARLSAGRPGWALTAANQPEVLARRVEIFDGLLGALRSNRFGRFAFSEAVASRADELPLVLDLWRSWWRDVVCISEGAHIEPVNADQWDTLAGVARAAGRQGARAALEAVHKTASLLNDTNVNPRLALDVMLLKLPYLS
jgi:DNA polymerase-3 subunit delta'